jgi:hypothetical protein
LAQPRFFHLCFLIAFVFAALGFVSQKTVYADDPRVSIAYTAWDDYFFYAAFEVNDHNVISKNRTPVSQPQDDDDVEVFFNTNPAKASDVRTSSTYQMAVSAGSGSYFSVGNGTKIPKGKLVLTYKYAVTIDGTLNDPSDNDTGFTVELAIPWQELGLTGPPGPGQTFGFNAISRNRESMDVPAQSFVSLSPSVLTSDDIQNPSKWTKMQFLSTLGDQTSGPAMVYCPRVSSDTQYPTIDGVVRMGEWNTKYGYSFGQSLIAGAAPSKDEEPNITESPFATTEQPVVSTPRTSQQPAAPANPASDGYMLTLPGGGEIHVGKLKPQPPAPVIVTVPDQNGHHKITKYPGSDTNPLAPNLPPDIDAQNPIGPTIDPGASLSLTQQKDLAPLIIAPYFCCDQPSTKQWVDQPINAVGPAFGGRHAQWHKDQLADARRAGIDVILPVVDADDQKSQWGLAALVEALKEMKHDGQDYPLLGLKIAGDNAVNAVKEFLTIVPQEFRAEVILPDSQSNQRAYIIFADTQPDVTAIKKVVTDEFDSPDTVVVTTPAGSNLVRITKVSPGGLGTDGTFVGRLQTHTIADQWQKVYTSNPNWVYIDSWNDFQNGTEIAASRQYGEQYADFTRASGLKWSGADQWDAKYLQNDAPAVIAQKTIYTVSVRVENNGSLPWRAGEGYSLCYRWYKDGRLYDDSAPRLPLNADVYPGESATLSVGVVAQNSAGVDLEPGHYTLVFDMLQGQSRWFSYVGSRPLRIPVRVEDKIDSPQALAEVIRSTTPAVLDNDGIYTVSLFIRNEGQELWTPTNVTVTLDGNRTAAQGTFSGPVYPGAIGMLTTTIQLPSGEPVGKMSKLIWTIKTPGTTQTWSEHSLIVEHDLGASFAENDVPRTVKTNDSIDAKAALYNKGPYTWNKGTWKIGYQWLYLDGTPATKESIAGALDTDAAPDTETATNIKLDAPGYPGKYQLVLDLQNAAGDSTLDEKVTRGAAVLPMIVSVEDGKNADAQTVSLEKYFTGIGTDYEGGVTNADFDGNGNALPAEFMPPDGTMELDVNPLLVGKAGPPEYPSGYYSAESGDLNESNHRIAFLYGAKASNNEINCNGQQIDIPSGKWKAIHILATAVGSDNVVPGQFIVGYKDGDVTETVQIANWAKISDPAAGTVALRLPYKLNKGAIVEASPVFLADYALPADPSRHVSHLTLPTNKQIKILAVTVER